VTPALGSVDYMLVAPVCVFVCVGSMEYMIVSHTEVYACRTCVCVCVIVGERKHLVQNHLDCIRTVCLYVCVSACV